MRMAFLNPGKVAQQDITARKPDEVSRPKGYESDNRCFRYTVMRWRGWNEMGDGKREG